MTLDATQETGDAPQTIVVIGGGQPAGWIVKTLRKEGFEGRLVILAEPDIETGDCKIEWADGGVTLDRAQIETKITELVGRYIASRNQADAPALRTEP